MRAIIKLAIVVLLIIGQVANAQQPLPTVTVETSQLRSDFLERQRLGFGYFFTSQDLEKRRLQLFTDLFRQVPGATVIKSDGLIVNRVRFRQRQCAPLVWLDGSPLSAGEFDLDILPVSAIEAVEVYNGQAPLVFARPGYQSCGTVVIWLKRK